MQRHLSPLACVAAAVAIGLVLAACGSSSSSMSGSPRPSGFALNSTEMHIDAVKAARCMRANGVPSFPDPTGNGIGLAAVFIKGTSGLTTSVAGVSVNSPAFRFALATCHADMPRPPVPSASQLPTIRRLMVVWATCVRSHGLPRFADPVITSDGHRITSGVNQDSPVYHAARQACDPGLARAMAAAGHPGGW